MKKKRKNFLALLLAGALAIGSVSPGQVYAASVEEEAVDPDLAEETVSDEAEESEASEESGELAAEEQQDSADSEITEEPSDESEDSDASDESEALEVWDEAEEQEILEEPTAAEEAEIDEEPETSEEVEEAVISEELSDASETEASAEEETAKEAFSEDAAEEETPVESAAGIDAFEMASNVEVVPFEGVETVSVTEVNPLYEEEIDISDIAEPVDEETAAAIAADSAEQIEVPEEQSATLYYDEGTNVQILDYEDGEAVEVVSDTAVASAIGTASEEPKEAEETKAQEAVETETGVVDSTAAVETSQEADGLKTIVAFNGNRYSDSLETVGAALREGLASRSEKIQVYYFNNNTALDETTYKKIFDKAVEHTGEPNEGDYLLWHYVGLSALTQHSPVSASGRSYYTITYTMTYYTTAAQEQEVDAATAALESKLGLASGKTDYEIVKKIYDYICENVEYYKSESSNSEDKLKYSAYAAIINKTAVCQGYSLFFYRMALMEGIDCRLIAGYGTTGNTSSAHAWNIVKIKGKWYNLDATWDRDHRPSYIFFLKNEANFTKNGSVHQRWGTVNSTNSKGEAKTTVYPYDTAAFLAQYPIAESDYTEADGAAINIEGADIAISGTYTYNGNAKVPKKAVTVRYNGEMLTYGTDYDIKYKNNINAGTAILKIIGIGNYTGKKKAEFTINPASISEASLSLSQEEYSYTGGEIQPAATLSVIFSEKEMELTPGTDYELSYSDNVGVGTATVKATGLGNFKDSVSVSFKINALDISSGSLTVEPASLTYSGEANSPSAVVVLGEKTLVFGTDYTLLYQNNVEAGTAGILAEGRGNYTGTLSGSFKIEPLSLTTAGKLEIANEEFEYDGEAKEPQVYVTAGGRELVRDVDYNVSYMDNIHSGIAKACVYGKGNYTGMIEEHFEILRSSFSRDVANATVFLSNTAYVYDGTEKKPTVNIYAEDSVHLEKTDFEVGYENNLKPGTAYVVIKGIGDYHGEKKVPFTIKKKQQSLAPTISSLALPVGSNATIKVNNAQGQTTVKSANTGIAQASSVGGGFSIKAIAVGKTQLVIQAAGNEYYDASSAKVDIEVIPVAPVISGIENDGSGVKLVWKNVSTADGYYVYRNGSLAKTLTKNTKAQMTYTDTGAKKNGTTYTYTLYSYKKLGGATYKSKVSGAKKSQFLSATKVSSLKNLSSRRMRISLKKNTKASGYKVQYCTNKSFKGAKTITLRGASATKKTLSRLKKGKTYYVRARAYKSGVYSDWGAVKAVKIRK